MRLISTQDVLNAMNVAGLAVSSPVSIDQAIDAATTKLESSIRSPLVYATRIDYFSITKENVNEALNGVRLRLTQRYLSDTLAVDLRGQGSLFALDFNSLVPYAQDKVHIDKNRGVLTFLDSPPVGLNAIAVKYTAGFKELDDKLPDSLKSALIQTAIGISYQSAVNSGSKKGNSRAHAQIFRLADSMVSNLIVPHSRLFVSPAMSSRVK